MAACTLKMEMNKICQWPPSIKNLDIVGQKNLLGVTSIESSLTLFIYLHIGATKTITAITANTMNIIFLIGGQHNT